MALQFGHNVAVEYARFIYLLYIDEKTAFTANRWRRFSKKSMCAIYVQEMELCVKQKPSKRSFDMNA
jgi:hypothetical protein